MATPGFPLTRDLTAALAGLRPGDLGAAAAQRAQIAFLDTLAVIAAGLSEPAVAALARTLGAEGGAAPAHLSARDRALVLGTAAHALDLDDVAFGGHVSAVLVPAILALLPALPQPVDGRRVLLAYAAGYEAWAEVSSRETTLYHAKGAHPTGLLGPIGAAAAAAQLWQLTAGQTAQALGIAASLGAGLTVNFGTMTKPFHAGRAAEAGVFAADLARHGLTAASDALEAWNGFLQVHSPQGAVDLARPPGLAGGALRLAGIAPSVKRFPVCYAAHRAIDAALALHAAGGFDPDALSRIEILISPRHSATLRYDAPLTVAEARFSLEFAVCTALLTGQVGLAQLQAGWLADPQLRRLMARCARRLSDSADPVLEGFAAFDQVTLHRDGAAPLPSPEVARALGHADLPLNPDQIAAKLADCLAQAGGLPPASQVSAAVAGLSDPSATAEALAQVAAAFLALGLPAAPCPSTAGAAAHGPSR